MKKIKIFSLPSHQQLERTSGVDLARIIQPSQHLNGYKDEDTKFEVRLYDIHKDTTMDWEWVAKNHDIIFFNYTALPWEFAKMGVMVRKYNKLLVMDTDDSLWNITTDNPIYQALKKGSEGLKNFTAICNEVDYMTTTNKYLRNVITHNTKKTADKVHVLPNCIDMDKLYTHRSELKDTNEIVLTHFGCFDDTTEILTENGFKLFKDLSPSDKVATISRDGVLEYQTPTDRQIYDYDGEMIRVKNSQVDLLVTPNHQLYADGEVKIAEQIEGKRCRMHKDSGWAGVEQERFVSFGIDVPMDDWLKFLGFWLAEGWVSKSKLKQKSGNITDCMQVGISNATYYKEFDSLVRVSNKEFWEYMSMFGGASEKYIPECIKGLSTRQLKILFDWYIKGDGHVDNAGRIRSGTVSKQLADDLVEVSLKIGMSANVRKVKKREVVIEGRTIPVSRMKDYYVVSYIRKSRCNPTVLPEHFSRETYKGKIYDVEVPNHTIFVKRNGVCIWSGNSTTHFLDLQTEEFEKGIDMIMKTYPNVIFKTIGSLIPKYKYKWGQRYRNDYGHQDVYKWIGDRFPMFMDECDIFVTPLAENTYTKCKSNIKYLEVSSAIKPGVWQRIRQYENIVKEGENGYLAYSAEDWFGAIKTLIDDKQLRQSVANKAYDTVKSGYQMKNNVYRYANFFKSIL